MTREGDPLILRNSVLIAATIALTASVASAAEAEWSKNSVVGFSVFVTLQKYRIYADHCSTRSPQLKPEFDSRVGGLNSRLQGISRDLLSSGAFNGRGEAPIPADIAFAFQDILNDARHNFERQGTDAVCQKTLQVLGDMDDESLKEDLRQTLVAIQNMTRNMEKESVR